MLISRNEKCSFRWRWWSRWWLNLLPEFIYFATDTLLRLMGDRSQSLKFYILSSCRRTFSLFYFDEVQWTDRDSIASKFFTLIVPFCLHDSHMWLHYECLCHTRCITRARFQVCASQCINFPRIYRRMSLSRFRTIWITLSPLYWQLCSQLRVPPLRRVLGIVWKLVCSIFKLKWQALIWCQVSHISPLRSTSTNYG